VSKEELPFVAVLLYRRERGNLEGSLCFGVGLGGTLNNIGWSEFHMVTCFVVAYL